MWIAIKRLQQGESLNIQDVKTNLFWEFGKFTSHDGESMESYYSIFYKMINEMIRNNLTVAMMQPHGLANPLALVAAASPYPDPYYQAPKSHKPYAPTSKQSSSTRSNASIKFKGKETAKPITPPSKSASEEDSDPEQAQRDKDMQKNLALIAKYFKKIYKPTHNNLKTSSNSKNKNVDTSLRYKNDNQTRKFGNQRTLTVAGARETIGSQVVHQTGIQCFNCKEFGHFAKECKKPKMVKDSMYHKEKMLLCKQAGNGVPLQVEQSDWLTYTDEEIDEQELKAHYNYMAKIQEVPTADSRTDTEPLEQSDQNAEDERVVLANLIENLKLDVDENKKIQKQLKKANTSLAHELKECKSILAETSRTLGESNSIRDSCQNCLKLVDQASVKHSHDHFRAPTAHDMEILIKTCLMPLAIKTQNNSFKFVHELKQEMHVDLKYVESLEKEIDELESDKAEFSNMYDILLHECVSNDVMCSYLHSLSDLDAHTELQ
ncbi:retrovirus-related pol polyprotein from transposon TNT 1-94 [Tanacetum coccineum]